MLDTTIDTIGLARERARADFFLGERGEKQAMRDLARDGLVPELHLDLDFDGLELPVDDALLTTPAELQALLEEVVGRGETYTAGSAELDAYLDEAARLLNLRALNEAGLL